MSGIKMFCGSDTPHKSIPIQKLEDQKEVVTALVTMGKEIGKHIEEKQ